MNNWSFIERVTSAAAAAAATSTTAAEAGCGTTAAAVDDVAAVVAAACETACFHLYPSNPYCFCLTYILATSNKPP